jgi:hypothetical protein
MVESFDVDNGKVTEAEKKTTRLGRQQRMNIALSPQGFDALEVLLGTGLFGHSRADVAQRLVCERLRELTLQGWIPTVVIREEDPPDGVIQEPA